MKRIDPRTGKTLPPIEVLEEIARITNAEVDADSQMAELLPKHAEATAKWHLAIKVFDKIRFYIDAIPARIERSNATIKQLEAQRPAIIAAGLFDEKGLERDDELLEMIAAEKLIIERLELALPVLSKRMAEANSAMAEAVRPVQGLEDEIGARRAELKLALAETRCR